MGLFKRKGWYYYQRQVQGVRYRQALGIRKGQEHLLSERLKQVEDELLSAHYGTTPPPPRRVLFSAYVETYLARKSYKASIDRDKQRLDIIRELVPDRPLQSIGLDWIVRLEHGLLDRGIKHATCNRYFELIRHLFNLAVEDRVLARNPLTGYSFFVEDQPSRFVTLQDFQAVVAAAIKMTEDPRDPFPASFPDMMIFSFFTGLRLSECLNLRRSQVSGNYAILPLTSTKWRRRSPHPGKGERAAYLSQNVLDIVARQPAVDEYVFNFPGRRHANAVSKFMIRLQHKTGIPFRFHDIRHLTATLAASLGDLLTAKTVLGHRDLRTTLRYAHPDEAKVKALGAKLASILGKT